jgi:glycoprotein-N-acetylgalactosamine 3-beta-galactosyltransferase
MRIKWLIRNILYFLFLILSTYYVFKLYCDTFFTNNQQKSFKLFCIITTHQSKLDTKCKTSYDTWVKECDDYVYLTMIPNNTKSNLFEIKYGIDKINLLQPPGFTNDNYRRLTDKVYSAFKYIYNRNNATKTSYDWYFKADDDTFVFMDNLRDYLKDKNKSELVTYGYDLKGPELNSKYHSGGAGYLMSSAAFDALSSKLTSQYLFCPNTGVEDIGMFIICLNRLFLFLKLYLFLKLKTLQDVYAN